MNQTISLCMIVRDEEHWIKQCLESVRDLVSEIIVLDTGSKDRTIEIAHSFGARIFEHPWVDDFSIVRNLSLSHAQGDWILVLDADEVIDPKDNDVIREHIKDQSKSYLFNQRHYTDDVRLSNFMPCKGENPKWERNYKGYFESALVRLFPNRKGVEYRGRVHELVEFSIYQISDLTIENSPIRIHHFGHTKESREKKSKGSLYTPLGMIKASEQEGDWKSYFELGVELNNNGRREDSVDAFKKALALVDWYPPCYTNLGYVLCELARYDEAIKVLSEGIRKFPNESETYCNLGVVYMRKGEFSSAEVLFRKAIAVAPEYVNAFKNLALSLVRQEKNTEAILAGRRVLQLLPSDINAALFLSSLYLHCGLAEKSLVILANVYRGGNKGFEIVQELCKAIRETKGAVDSIRFLLNHLGNNREVHSENEKTQLLTMLDKANIDLFLQA